MKNIMKKLVSMLVVCTLMLSTVNVAFASGIETSIEEAYEECAALYPEFVDTVKAQGVTDAQIITFLKTMQDYMIDLGVEINEDNFEDYIIGAVNDAISYRKNIAVRDALLAAYPGAVVDGMDGIISPEFEPLVETIKVILFGGEETEETTEKETEAPTEEDTVAPTDKETVAPSEEETVAPTEKETVAPSEEETVAPTEEKTDAPTEKETHKPSGGNGGPSGGYGDDGEEESETEAPTTPTAPIFTDMNQAAWAEEAVKALVGMGIINGYGDGTFKPNSHITRAEFSKIIVLASGRYQEKDKATYVSSFTDVKTTDWHYSYVSAAYKFGYIKGRSETIFDPNSNITRADLCLIVYRYIKTINPEFKAKTDANGVTPTFADAMNVPSYASEAVTALYSNGVAPLRDATNNKFEPTLPATRAECAVIVYNAINAALGIKK